MACHHQAAHGTKRAHETIGNGGNVCCERMKTVPRALDGGSAGGLLQKVLTSQNIIVEARLGLGGSVGARWLTNLFSAITSGANMSGMTLSAGIGFGSPP